MKRREDAKIKKMKEEKKKAKVHEKLTLQRICHKIPHITA